MIIRHKSQCYNIQTGWLKALKCLDFEAGWFSLFKGEMSLFKCLGKVNDIDMQLQPSFDLIKRVDKD